jgi:drug/metabolite transporter (DMT)-like permease
MEQPLMLQNSILYAWGVIMNGISWGWSIHNGAPVLGKFGWLAFLLCVFNAIYGLSISVILKRFGALTRTFISTIAIVFNALLDTVFFNEKITVLELTTFFAIFAAIFLFTIIGDEWNKMASAASPSTKPCINSVELAERSPNLKGKSDSEKLLDVNTIPGRNKDLGSSV